MGCDGAMCGRCQCRYYEAIGRGEFGKDDAWAGCDGYPQTIEQYLEHMSDEILELAIAGVRQLMTPEELQAADGERA